MSHKTQTMPSPVEATPEAVAQDTTTTTAQREKELLARIAELEAKAYVAPPAPKDSAKEFSKEIMSGEWTADRRNAYMVMQARERGEVSAMPTIEFNGYRVSAQPPAIISPVLPRQGQSTVASRPV